MAAGQRRRVFGAMSSSSSSINVRFLIDREQKKVVFVEAGSDFVDVLFSFLTLPLGTIVRLLGKQSGLGSLDILYKSIEELDAEHLQTEAYKDMLLNPRSAAARLCQDLKIQGIHDPYPRNLYTCSQDDCLIHSTCYYTYTTKVLCCRCGKLMDKVWHWRKKASEEQGVFVKTTNKFMITDDLQVIPTSLLKSFSLLQEMQIKHTSTLEERVMEFGTKEALNLLRKSFVSRNALTEVCFPDALVHGSAASSFPIKEEIVADEAQKEIKLQLILNKKNNKVLCAQVGDDFINQLFSFLALPLGSVLKFLYENRSSLHGCIQNLYSSAVNMDLDYFKSEICKNRVLSPKISIFYGYKNHLILELEEIKPTCSTVKGSCAKCYADNGYKISTSAQCIHGIRESKFVEKDPKSAKGLLDNGRGFLSGCTRFVVMDNFRISLLSAISTLINGENFSISDIVGKESSVDKCKARSLLHAMLISKTVLTDVFCPEPKQSRRNSVKFS